LPFDRPDDVVRHAIAPGGALVAVARHDGTVELWSSSERRQIAAHRGDPVSDFAFSRDARWLAIDRAGVVFRVETVADAEPSRLGVLGYHDSALVVDTRARRVAAADLEGVWLLARDPLRRTMRLADHAGRVTSLAFDPTDARLVTASDDGTLRVWDAATGLTMAVIEVGAPVVAVAFLDEDHLVSATRAGRLALHQLRVERRSPDAVARVIAALPWRVRDGRLERID
jgi:WD40 repeat protein